MKLGRILLAGVLFAMVASVAYVAQRPASPGVKMVAAAQKLLDSLAADQKKKAVFEFDSKERTNWWYVPRQDAKRNPTRNGLALLDMTAEQKKLALTLVAAGTSTAGNAQVTTIMSLEAILREQEKKGTNVRDPEWYFFTIFGTPGKDSKWGWRVEGHHLSLNFVVDKGQVIASTPAFLGANPAQIKAGKDKGKRILPEVEDLARELFTSLSDEQKKAAYRDTPFAEPKQNTVAPDLGEPSGLSAAKMTRPQRSMLLNLLQGYTNRMPQDVADAEWRDIHKAGVDKIHFGYSGSADAGKGYTYRVHGPTFVIEFLNMQADSAGNVANHIHSVWRRVQGDFGTNVK